MCFTYLEKRGKPVTARELASHDCLIFRSRHRKQRWDFLGDDGEWVKAEARSRVRLDSGEALHDAAVDGAGIAFLPDFLIDKDLVAGRLEQILPGLVSEEVKIVTIYPTKRMLEPRVRYFIDLMIAELGT